MLKVEPNADKTGPVFSILRGEDAENQGGNGAQRREYDKKLGAGTMSRSGATCVCCGLPSMTMEDIRLERRQGGWHYDDRGSRDGPKGKEYRAPTEEENHGCPRSWNTRKFVLAKSLSSPLGTVTPATAASKFASSTKKRYGLYECKDLYTHRQLLRSSYHSLGHTRADCRSPQKKKNGIPRRMD